MCSSEPGRGPSVFPMAMAYWHHNQTIACSCIYLFPGGVLLLLHCRLPMSVSSATHHDSSGLAVALYAIHLPIQAAHPIFLHPALPLPIGAPNLAKP